MKLEPHRRTGPLVVALVAMSAAVACQPATVDRVESQGSFPVVTEGAEQPVSTPSPTSVRPQKGDADTPIEQSRTAPTGLPARVSGFEQRWAVDMGPSLPQTVLPDGRQNGVVYVAAKGGGVEVLGTDGSRLATVARGSLGGLDAMNLVQEGERLYVALGDFFAPQSAAGLAVLNVADPSDPRVAGTWRSSDGLKGVADLVVVDTTVYLAAMEHGIIVVDVADPATPAEVSRVLPDPQFPNANPSSIARPNARGLAVTGDLLFVANDAGGLRALDIEDRHAPIEIGRHINAGPTKQQAYNDLVLAGDLAYVAQDYCGFEVVDIANPRDMRTVSWLDPWDCNSLGNPWLNSPGHTNQLHLDTARQTLWVAAGDSELLAIDVADPVRPQVTATVGAPANNRGTYGLGADHEQIYLAYITTIVPFQGRFSGVVAVAPT